MWTFITVGHSKFNVVMYLIQSLNNEFSFDLPLFSKYLATSINSYFYKMTLVSLNSDIFLFSEEPILFTLIAKVHPSSTSEGFEIERIRGISLKRTSSMYIEIYFNFLL